MDCSTANHILRWAPQVPASRSRCKECPVVPRSRFGRHEIRPFSVTGTQNPALLSAARAMNVKASLKSHEYNRIMQEQMRNPYEYHHDLGMNYTRITPNLIVGSQPQKREDVHHLKNEAGVNVILNLQQDKDVGYWGIDLGSIIRCCQDLGIRHLRCPAIDFDSESLRNQLPKAVSLVDEAILRGDVVYVHCTAGLGRAPAVIISYLFWFSDVDLNTAYEMLTSRRPCGPRKEAIRGATYDLAKDSPWKEPFENLSDRAFTNIADWERELIRHRVRALCVYNNS